MRLVRDFRFKSAVLDHPLQHRSQSIPAQMYAPNHWQRPLYPVFA